MQQYKILIRVMSSMSQVSILTSSLQDKILSLISRNMELEQITNHFNQDQNIQIITSQNQTLKKQNQTLKKKLQQLKQASLESQTKIKTLEKSLQQAEVKNQELSQNIFKFTTQINQLEHKTNDLLLQIQNIKTSRDNMLKDNNQLVKEINGLKIFLEERNQSLIQSEFQSSQMKKSLMEAEQFKDIKICQQCKVKIYMCFYNKQKKYRELKAENQRLNSYMNEVINDPRFSNSINNIIRKDEINQNILNFQKETNRQFHLYTVCDNEERKSIVKNLSINLRNLKKQIQYIIFRQ